MVSVAENVGGGLVDRHRAGAGGRVGLLARMQAERVETEEFRFQHLASPCPAAEPDHWGRRGPNALITQAGWAKEAGVAPVRQIRGRSGQKTYPSPTLRTDRTPTPPQPRKS